MDGELTRRGMLAGGLAFAGAARAGAPAGRRLAFEVWRGDRRIGRHTLAFDGGGGDLTVAIEAIMAVSLGPIPIFRYHHQAREVWRGGAFTELTSQTVTNGRREELTAVRAPEGVMMRSASGARRLPADALPLTHWNAASLAAPLFNPQTGAPMRERVSKTAGQTLRPPGGPPIAATRYALLGDANLTDWYDADGVWAALTAIATDGSRIDYRRVA